jgi:hypothetical protein
MREDNTLHVAAAGLGALVWIVIASVSGRSEAWDAGAYFSLGLPLVCLASLAFAYFRPEHPWRWGVLPFAGQLLVALLMVGPGNLLPLGIVAFALFSLPAVFAARIGARLASRRG